MRLRSRLDLATIVCASCLFAHSAISARAEDQPGYWATPSSLAQPASESAAFPAEDAPLPRSAPVPATQPLRQVRPVSHYEPISTPLTNQTRQALNFYGGQNARSTFNQMPRRTPIRPATTGQMRHDGKPFENVSTRATVSPYLNLFRDENEESESAPNYFAFVRPQLDQQETMQRQQRELDRLNRQIQNGPGVPYQSSGGPARFMDTAQFYGGWRK